MSTIVIAGATMLVARLLFSGETGSRGYGQQMQNSNIAAIFIMCIVTLTYRMPTVSGRLSLSFARTRARLIRR